MKTSRSRAPLLRRMGFPLGVMGFFMVLLFQNCDGGFHYDSTAGSLGQLGGGVGSDQFKITTFNPSGIVLPEGSSFEGGLEYKIVATGTSLSTAVLSWTLSTNTGSCVLKAGTTPETRFITCTKSGNVSVQATAIWADGSTSVLASQRTTGAVIVDNCGAPTPDRVVFRIPVGTGTNPWNSSASPVLTFVGQTLRICNDDTGPHRLRTPGSPCPQQPADMANGGFYDCAIANTTGVNPTTGVFPGLYDLNAGVNAAFYVRALDGIALYADGTKTSSGQSCASCHNAFATSTKKGASFTALKNAIATNRGGMGVYSGIATDDELRAIVYSLSK